MTRTICFGLAHAGTLTLAAMMTASLFFGGFACA